MVTVSSSSGTSLWYETRGWGPTVFHIHGSAFGHKNFELLTPELTDHLEVVDFDLPGFGGSEAPARPCDIHGFADVVAGLVGDLGYERVHVHGTSLGAMIGLSLAARHPEVVDRLVLSCFLARYDAAARAMRATWKEAARASGMAAVADLTSVAGFSRGFFETEGATAQLQRICDAFVLSEPASFVAATEAIERLDLSPLADAVQAPTLLLAGAEDQMTPVEPGASGVGFAQLREAIPDSRAVVLPRCGHYLVIERPAEAAAHIVRFLGEA